MNAKDLERHDPPYPVEFVGALSDAASQTLMDWLKANHAPEVVVNMVNDTAFLRMMESRMKEDPEGQLPHWDVDSMVECVSNTLHGIVQLGGVFSLGGTITLARDPVPWPVVRMEESETVV